ncbi:MAG: hydrogenase nickel incorporation protein HypB [Deltaproteobacteria bacterium]|nr:hydrogenase nickel incorporation protein HypB [Deltaproteobacteria bacterium]
MCTTCGCGDPELVPVELHEKILAGNDRTAAHNRAHFGEAGVLALNLMGSPGSGKTAVLEATAALLPGVRMAAVSADLATDNDARRLTRAGIPSQAITTGQACHLDAELVHASLHGFDWSALDLFFIENVGNLVCPAIYDLGQAASVVVLSVTEGEDKPLKYPVMFQKADLVLVTKADLVPHLDVDVAAIRQNLARVMPEPRMILVSARSGLGMGEWKAWIDGRRPRRAGTAPLAAHHHSHGHDPAHTHDHPHEHDHGHGHDHPHAHDHGHAHHHGHTRDAAPTAPAAVRWRTAKKAAGKKGAPRKAARGAAAKQKRGRGR